MSEEQRILDGLLRATLEEEEKVLSDILRWYDTWEIENKWVRIHISQAKNHIAKAKKEIISDGGGEL